MVQSSVTVDGAVFEMFKNGRQLPSHIESIITQAANVGLSNHDNKSRICGHLEGIRVAIGAATARRQTAIREIIRAHIGGIVAIQVGRRE